MAYSTDHGRLRRRDAGDLIKIEPSLGAGARPDASSRRGTTFTVSVDSAAGTAHSIASSARRRRAHARLQPARHRRLPRRRGRARQPLVTRRPVAAPHPRSTRAPQRPMKCSMTHARHSEAGFALIEVIVSAAVLAIVALAVLSGIDGATASTAREKARAVAATLAEQDQERLRSYRFDELTKLVGAAGADRELNVDGVELQRQVRGHAGHRRTPTPGCGAAGAKQNEYLHIISTVTSAMVGVRIAPVKIESLVAPARQRHPRRQGGHRAQRRRPEHRGDRDQRQDRPHATPSTTNGDGCALFVGSRRHLHGEHQQAGLRRPRRRAGLDGDHHGHAEPRERRDDELRHRGQHAGQRQDPAAGHGVQHQRHDVPSKAVAISDNAADQSTLRTFTPATPSVHGRRRASSSRSRPPTASSPATADPEPGQGRRSPNYFTTTNTAAAVIGDPTKPQPQVATVFQPPSTSASARRRAPRRRASTRRTSRSTFVLQKVGADSCDDFQGTQMGVKTWPGGTWGTASPNGSDAQLGRPERHGLRPGPAVRHLQDLPQRQRLLVDDRPAPGTPRLRQHQARAGDHARDPADARRATLDHDQAEWLLMSRLRPRTASRSPSCWSRWRSR